MILSFTNLILKDLSKLTHLKIDNVKLRIVVFMFLLVFYVIIENIVVMLGIWAHIVQWRFHLLKTYLVLKSIIVL